MRVPPGHIGLRQACDGEEVGDRANEIRKNDEQQSRTKEPQGHIHAMRFACEHRHPDVDRQRNENEHNDIDV